jgi:hypothetical protein
MKNLNQSNNKDFTRSDFLEWFRGLVDSEGSFRVIPIKGVHFGFGFEIGMHVDDINGLLFIQETLQIGKISYHKNMAFFRIGRQEELKKRIDIFSNAPLNTSKQLNFLDFKKAFELYTETKNKDILLKLKIDEIISRMNKKRQYSESTIKDIKITPYWLLGFVEGDGSFSIQKGGNFILVFSITQVSKDLPLLGAIKDFICNLPGDYKIRSNHNGGVVNISTSQSVGNPASKLGVTNRYFLKNVLVPFFDSLVWHTKKELDYKDWKTVMNLKETGQHYTTEGYNVICKILSRMNNNRLSTNSLKVELVDGPLLQIEIDKLLAAPSNLEIKEEGRIFIKSLNKYYSDRSSLSVELHNEEGLVVNTFGSITDCAKFLSISRAVAGVRLHEKKPVLFNNKLFYIKRSSETC